MRRILPTSSRRKGLVWQPPRRATTSPTSPWPTPARSGSSGQTARCPCCARSASASSASSPLDGITMACCLHVTTETANLVRTLMAGGAEVALCASNPLSTQDDVGRRAGRPLRRRGLRDQRRGQRHLLPPHRRGRRPAPPDHHGRRRRRGQRPARRAPEQLSEVIGGTEETTTGVIRLKALEAEGKLGFPIIAVNDANTKHFFDNRYGTGQSTLDGVIRATNVLIAGLARRRDRLRLVRPGRRDARQGPRRPRDRLRGRPAARARGA